VVSGLYGASRLIAEGNSSGAKASLDPEVFTAPDTTLLRLATLPSLPRTRSATSLAERELHRIDNQNHFNGGGDSGAHP
jgi:hypothetical protein